MHMFRYIWTCNTHGILQSEIRVWKLVSDNLKFVSLGSKIPLAARRRLDTFPS